MLGDSGYALGARAKQIRDALYARPRLGERDLLAIQLDDRALFLARWRDHLGERGTAQLERQLVRLREITDPYR